MTAPTRIYWHHELPPLEHDPVSEHVVQARSDVVPYRPGHLDDLNEACLASLRNAAAHRLEQELDRLGGDSAHVTDEEIEAKHDEASATFSLQGTYTYVLYRAPARGEGRSSC